MVVFFAFVAGCAASAVLKTETLHGVLLPSIIAAAPLILLAAPSLIGVYLIPIVCRVGTLRYEIYFGRGADANTCSLPARAADIHCGGLRHGDIRQSPDVSPLVAEAQIGREAR